MWLISHDWEQNPPKTWPEKSLMIITFSSMFWQFLNRLKKKNVNLSFFFFSRIYADPIFPVGVNQFPISQFDKRRQIMNDLDFSNNIFLKMYYLNILFFVYDIWSITHFRNVMRQSLEYFFWFYLAIEYFPYKTCICQASSHWCEHRRIAI